MSECYLTDCSFSPVCQENYYYSGNYTYETCSLRPLYIRFECCELPLEMSSSSSCQLEFCIMLFLNIIFFLIKQ